MKAEDKMREGVGPTDGEKVEGKDDGDPGSDQAPSGL